MRILWQTGTDEDRSDQRSRDANRLIRIEVDDHDVKIGVGCRQRLWLFRMPTTDGTRRWSEQRPSGWARIFFDYHEGRIMTRLWS